MRYWIYKDAQIIGPMSPEEVLHIEGAGKQLLLCPDGVDGSRESDWKTAGEIPELADLLRDRTPEVATALQTPEFQTWPMRDFSPEELIGLPYFQFWEPTTGQPPRREAEFDTQSRRSQELAAKLNLLEEKMLQYERREGEILDRLSEKDTLLENQEKEIQRLKKELEQSRSSILEPHGPPQASQEPAERKPKTFEIPDEKLELGPILPPSPEEPAEKKPKVFEIPAAMTLAPLGYDPLSVSPFAPPMPASIVPSPAPTPPPVTWSSDALPTTSMPVPTEPSSAFAPPDPMPSPSLPSEIMSPLSEFPSPGLASLASSPAPLPQSSAPSDYTPLASDIPTPDPFSLPHTVINASGSPKVPGFSWPPTGSPGQMEESTSSESPATGAPAQVTEAPASLPASAAAAPKSGRAKKWVLFTVVIALGMIAGFLYLSKDTKTTEVASSDLPASNAVPPSPMVGSTASNPTVGSAASNPAPVPASSNSPAAGSTAPSLAQGPDSSNPSAAGPALTGSPTASVPSSQPGTTPSTQNPEVAAPQDAKQSSPGPDYVADHSEDAIDLVKNYSLDGGRGTVAKWLQYSYPPGSQEKWTANPGDSAGIYMVQYQVLQESPTSQKAKSPVYVFQADISGRSVQGFNRAAKDLLAGAVEKKPVHKQVAKKKKTRKHRALKPGEIPLLPLPSDADLPHTHHGSVDAEQ